MVLPITLTIAAALALLNVGLALRVTRVRLGARVSMGHAGDSGLEARTRAHANLIEYAPFVLILLALIELAGGSPFWLWVAGAAFVLARVAHAFGMGRPVPNPFRAGGALATWALLLLLAGWGLAIAYADPGRSGPAIIEPMGARA